MPGPILFMMRVLVAPLVMLSLAFEARAGDRWEAYFLIVGSVKAKPYNEYRFPDFMNEMSNFRNEYSRKCGVKVDVWHSDLVEGFDGGYFFAFTISDADRAVIEAFPRNDPCSRNGYVKKGFIVEPTIYQYCAFAPINDPDGRYLQDPAWRKTCE